MSEKIRVHKKNEVFLHLETDPSVEMELWEFFSFFAVGYQWMPAYKNKMWDGKIRLFDRKLKTLYGGLFPYLQEFAETRKCELEIVGDWRKRTDVVLPDELVDFVKGLNLHAHGKDIAPRDYQMEAIYRTLIDQKRLLLSPTASGKSLII